MTSRPCVTRADGIRASVLGSGSRGNAIAVNNGGRGVLLDCGFSARETLRRLCICDVEASSIEAIVVSHEHSDHVRGVRVLAKRLDVPVYASRGTRRAASLDDVAADVRELRAGEPVVIAGMEVTPFSASHDAAEPLGFRFDVEGSSLGILTDSGELTREAAEVLAGCGSLGIECNHDVDMLVDGPYPWFLKKRILSSSGHLSNADAASAVAALASDALLHVVALHLSSTNNTGVLASASLTGALARIGHPARVSAATQAAPCAL